MPRQKEFTIYLPPQRAPEADLRNFREFTTSTRNIFRNKPEVDYAMFEAAGKPRPLVVRTEILLPEYAIGVGLITRDEYETIRRDYFTQTQWTLGLIIPLIMLWIAFVIRPEPLVLKLHVLFGLLIGAALIGGMDRLHNYNAQLQSLIAGKYVAKLMAREAAEAAAAAPKPPAASAAPTLKDVRGDLAELKGLIERESQRPPITVVNNVPAPHTHHEPAEPPPTETEGVSDAAQPNRPEDSSSGEPEDMEALRMMEEVLEILRRKRRASGGSFDLRPKSRLEPPARREDEGSSS